MQDLVICAFNIAEVAAETILIQFFVSFAVPETAGIRRNLVRKHNCAVAQSSELKFEIDKLDVDFRKECGQNFVDFQSVFF